MVTVGALAQFEFNNGDDPAVDRFFQDGKLVVDGQPASTVWFAFRTGRDSYGAFAAFESEHDRQALLASGGPKLARGNAALFAHPPSFEMVDIVAARHTGG
jgi:hypothetical protein